MAQRHASTLRTRDRSLKAARAVASFDSATGMLRALARFLAGRDTPLIGQAPGSLEPLLSALLGVVNHLPRRMADRVYATSGVAEAVPRSEVGALRAEDLAQWVVEHYPQRRYPVIFIGSSNGALVHLAAALGAPWLPQTLLVPVRRRGIDRDDAEGEMQSGLDPGRALLEANPELALHHMHDPNQDRLMIAGMSYFRIKWQRLPKAYRQFIADHLQPGGAVISVECTLTWPTTQVGDRHVFQFGAFGGASAEEYREGGDRVSDLLSRYRANRREWTPPASDGDSPEAEWGFDRALLADVQDMATRGGFQFQRLRFDHPEQLSAPVAELYKRWYRDRGIEANRLLAECFLLLEPWWALRTGSVPFWVAFNTEGSLQALHTYLDSVDSYDEIRMMLFSHGTESIGLAGVQDWQHCADRARRFGTLLGVDKRAFPRDFATFARAHRDLARVQHAYPMPQPLPLREAQRVLEEQPDVHWSSG